jgi:hypothetical protein
MTPDGPIGHGSGYVEREIMLTTVFLIIVMLTCLGLVTLLYILGLL